MSLDFIDTLRATPPRQRLALLKQQQQRNIEFLRHSRPELSQQVAKIGFGRFRIVPDAQLVSVRDGHSRGLLHPPGKLAEFCQQLGQPHHAGWWDYRVLKEARRQRFEHDLRVFAFQDQIRAQVPAIPDGTPPSGIPFPTLANGRAFSPLTVFLGLNTGVHIAYYLAATEVQDMVLIEPDIERFALSCLFVDYAALGQQHGHLHLVVGEVDVDYILSWIINQFPLTAQAWVRLLRAYDDPLFNRMHNTLNVYFDRSAYLPFERELRALDWMRENVQAQRPIWQSAPQLSAQAQIAVVGAGPSLNRDIPWLQAQRERLIVIAVVSAVKPLRAAGIIPDFQCVLDLEHPISILERLSLIRSVPLLARVKADPEMLTWVDEALLFVADESPSLVDIPATWSEASPTSGNLGLVAALNCRPQAIYLVGLDMGFRSDQASHAEGTLHEFRQKDEHHTAPLARLNHPDPQGDWVTTSYLTTARQGAERALAQWATAPIRVYNLSQGAWIKGAEPAVSAQVQLPDYPQREADMQRIRQAFVPNPPYTHYRWMPEECIGAAVQQLAHLGAELDWPQLTHTLDNFWYELIQRSMSWDATDRRLMVFQHLWVNSLLGWYRLLWLAPPEQRQAVYHCGLQVLRSQWPGLNWPGAAADVMRPMDREAAEAHYRQRYSEDPDAKDYLVRMAEGLAAAEDWEGALALAAEDHALGRLSPIWHIRIAEWSQRLGRTAEAQAAIEYAYAQDSCLRDGFVTLAQPSITGKDWVEARRWLDQDYAAGRMSPRWWMQYAQVLGRVGEFDLAQQWVERAYAQNELWKDGFASLGWIKTEAKDWAGALAIAARDEQFEERLSPGWQINLAQLYGRCGEFDRAVGLIEAIYAEHPQIKDGFARLGWIKAEAWDWRGALDIAQRDIDLQRLSPAWQANLGLAEGIVGHWERAEELIDQAYFENHLLKEFFINLGWIGYSYGKGADYLQRLANKDITQGRASIGGGRATVFNLIAAGKAEPAIQAAEAIYADFPKTEPHANYLLSLIACRLYLQQGKYEQALELLASDFERDRMPSDSWKALYALLLASSGQRDEALNILDTQLLSTAPQALLILYTNHRPGTVAILTLGELRACLTQGQAYREVIERYAVTAPGVVSQAEPETPAQNGETRLLSQQMRLKFGDLPPWAQAQLNASTPEQRERWAERILTADSLEAVLAD